MEYLVAQSSFQFVLTPWKQVRMKCCELFSGIGGLREGFSEYISECISYDMNENANIVYKSNFKEKPRNRSISCLKLADIENFDIILLSPNCQPFTQGGKGLDNEDERTKPLLHVMKLINDMEIERLPSFIFLENVAPFFDSKTYALLEQILIEKVYSIQPTILSPHQIGVPNYRKRFYCLAWKDNNPRKIELVTCPFEDVVVVPVSLRKYLEGVNQKGNLVPSERIAKFPTYKYDVVSLSCNHSSTITKSYGSKNLIGCGSLLTDSDICTFLCKSQREFSATDVISIKPRFMSHKELLILFGFPKTYKIDCELTESQKLKLIGNSVNVTVVRYLARYMLSTIYLK
eukprot:NODE_608_length_5442_cov_0.955830.p1 type:complete len:346 gc:universal NODE_608_length_5442_cov_0.955830:3212-2175(-)